MPTHGGALPPIYVWRDSPLEIERPFWASVARGWGSPTTFICAKRLPPERALLNWGSDPVDEVILEDREGPRYIDDNIGTIGEALNLFYGFRWGKGGQMRRIWRANSGALICVIAERPTDHGSGLKGTCLNGASNLLYRYLAARYGSRIGALFSMGARGEAEYLRLGFSAQKIRPFMYVPRTYPVRSQDPDDLATARQETRFLYVGRLDARHKGLDILLAATKRLHGAAWHLGIVGGYGDMSAEVRSFTQANPNVDFLGPWPAAEVVSRMREYDVCVVPSRYDGWNVVTNQAINAGLAVIATNTSTSDELVKTAGNGLVVAPGDPLALSDAMARLAGDPSLVNHMKRNSLRFASRISVETVSDYMLASLRYLVSQHIDSKPPSPPWR